MRSVITSRNRAGVHKPVGHFRQNQANRLAPDVWSFPFVGAQGNWYQDYSPRGAHGVSSGSGVDFQRGVRRNNLYLSKTDNDRRIVVPSFTLTSPWSISWRAHKRPAGDNNDGMLCGTTNATQQFLWQREGSDIQIRGTSDVTISGFNTPEDGWHSYTVTTDAQSPPDWEYYVDGVSVGTNTSASVSGTLVIAAVFDGYTSSSFDYDGDVEFFYVHGRQLLDAEVRELHARPYQFFDVISRRAYFVPAVGGGFQSAWAKNATVTLQPGQAG